MKKLIILLVAVSYFGMLQAQETSKFTFNNVALSLKDVDKSAIFHKELLQLKEITNRTKMDGIRWFSFGEDNEFCILFSFLMCILL